MIQKDRHRKDASIKYTFLEIAYQRREVKKLFSHFEKLSSHPGKRLANIIDTVVVLRYIGDPLNPRQTRTSRVEGSAGTVV